MTTADVLATIDRVRRWDLSAPIVYSRPTSQRQVLRAARSLNRLQPHTLLVPTIDAVLNKAYRERWRTALNVVATELTTPPATSGPAPHGTPTA